MENVVFELIQCELDERNHRHNDQRVGIFADADSVYNYLTDDGNSHDVVSILNHEDNSREYVIPCFDCVNKIIKVHTEDEGNPLIGWDPYSYDTYYYCQVLEVRKGRRR